MADEPDLASAVYPRVDDNTALALRRIRDSGRSCPGHLVPGYEETLVYLAHERLIKARKLGAKKGAWLEDAACYKLVVGRDPSTFEVCLNRKGSVQLGRWESDKELPESNQARPGGQRAHGEGSGESPHASQPPAHVNPKRRLFDALIHVYCIGVQLAATLQDLRAQWERSPKGPDKSHLPTRDARELRAKIDAEVKAREAPGTSMSWGPWVTLLDAVSNEFQIFNLGVETALKLVGGVAGDMNDPKEPAPKHWTFRARDVLSRVTDCCQVHKWGLQGHRFWSQPPDDPKDFRAALARIPLLTHDLWCAGAGEGPEPDLPAAPKSSESSSPSTPHAAPPTEQMQAQEKPKDAGQPFIPNAFQRLILEKLDQRAMKTDQLGREVNDRRRLFKKNGIKQLIDHGLVQHHERIGYYRPDKPPPEHADALAAVAPKGHQKGTK